MYSPGQIHTLYTSLEPTSVAQHAAFYTLFPESAEGKKALQEAWSLLSATAQAPLPLPLPHTLSAVLQMLTKAEGRTTNCLNDEQLALVSSLASRLPNRLLLGAKATSEAEVLQLPESQIDVARALLLAQAAKDPSLSWVKIATYEALMDLMALEVLAKIPIEAPPKQKIRALNRLIFEELGYRFPPLSSFVQEVDLYSYLPSVLDSRKGVCLGVSLLYLCVGQRIGLPLQAITPPGHIYVRFFDGKETINIETTARGIHIEDEAYLGIEGTVLTPRTLKETIGLAAMNEASVHWQNNHFDKALACYQQAEQYITHNSLLYELIGYQWLFLGNREKAKYYFLKAQAAPQDQPYAQGHVLEDFLAEKVDEEGLKALFFHVNEERSSLLEKKELLEKTVTRCPTFRAAHFSLAVTYLQLHRPHEALQALEKYYALEPKDPTALYFLAQLHAQRYNFSQAWSYLHQAEPLLSHAPRPLKQLRRTLQQIAPD